MLLVFSIQSFHIRRVEDDAVYRGVLIRQVATVYAGFEISSEKLVVSRVYVPPEYAQAVRYIGHFGAFGNMQPKDNRENVRVISHMSGQHDL